MPKGQYEHKPRTNRREEILDAATKIYAHYGFEGATLEKMAREAGVTRQLITKYFGNKQDLVREIADRAIRRSLGVLRGIDDVPGLTLRQRAGEQFAHMKPAREEWCLIVGTLLVPNFQFGMRRELEQYIDAEYAINLTHITEFKDPRPEIVYAYTYADVSMRIGFVVDGKGDGFLKAQAVHQDIYLLAEKDILEGLE